MVCSGPFVGEKANFDACLPDSERARAVETVQESTNADLKQDKFAQRNSTAWRSEKTVGGRLVLQESFSDPAGMSEGRSAQEWHQAISWRK
jgi:hypothetical protein